MNSKKMFFVLMALWFVAISLFVAYKEYYYQDSGIVLLRITPVDSRDLYDKKGNLLLTYDISKINPSQTFSSSKLPSDGDTVYVSLVDNGRFVIGSDIDSNPPNDRLFIKGQ
ncbi:MAG: hypothetical protein LBV16_04950, partial [Elusimicrobiota bacterium]|nr:hypothetical protein [Elusimicrobiota bacterium]